MLSQSSRAMKPKLSLSINTATASTRPSLSLKSPSMSTTTSSSLRSPALASPSPVSPTARNTRLNQRGYSTMQRPSYDYVNASGARSILKKHHGSGSSASSGRRQLSFDEKPMVYCVTPIEAGEEYYGASVRVGRDERRWGRR